jgi:hypothetical protein
LTTILLQDWRLPSKVHAKKKVRHQYRSDMNRYFHKKGNMSQIGEGFWVFSKTANGRLQLILHSSCTSRSPNESSNSRVRIIETL